MKLKPNESICNDKNCNADQIKARMRPTLFFSIIRIDAVIPKADTRTPK